MAGKLVAWTFPPLCPGARIATATSAKPKPVGLSTTAPRFHCTACDKDYTPQPKQQGYDAQTRQQAVALHLEGLSLRAVHVS
jgi:transposase-like protein